MTQHLISRQDIVDFLMYETSLLDARRLKEWLDLVSDDFTYKVPVTSTPASLEGQAWSDDYLVVDETKDSIAKLWLVRHSPDSWDFAWGENPAQRVRRFVTNTRISPGKETNTHVANSNVLMTFVRESEPVVLMPAERIDVVRHVDGQMQLASRVVKIDTSVIRTGHLRLIF